MLSSRFAFVLCLVARSARADEIIVVHDDGDAATERDRALGEAPFVSVVRPSDRPADASVGDAIGSIAGVQLRSLGGPGAFQSVAIRGASPGQTVVAIDGVPLARIAAVTTDVGRFALDAFERVDVYRGTVPAALGGAGVGGAIDLVTRLGRGDRGERMRLSVGGGSYAARHARAHYGDAIGGVRFAATAGYAGAAGDFAFFDNAGTPLNLHDDATRPRANNGFDQGDLAVRAGVDPATAAGVRLAYRDQGLPGATTRPTMAARLATFDAIADARARGVTAYALVERQRLADPADELGLGAQRRGSWTIAGGVSAMRAWTRASGDRLVLGGELRGERFADEDLDGAMPAIDGNRGIAAAHAAIDLALAPELVVTPAVRLDAVRTAPAATTVGPDAYVAIAPRSDVVPSPRLGARALLRPDLAVKGSAGYYVRLPTLLELFGNRGFILGTPTLSAERGPSTDLGVVYAPHATAWLDRIFVEAAVFGTRSRDTIAFVTYAGAVTRAQNLGRTQSYGAEVAASMRVARSVSVGVTYTRLATEQASRDVAFDGRAIPRSPGHQLHARVELAVRRVALYGTVDAQSQSYLDAANLGRVPGRALVGAGASWDLTSSVAIALSVENLADTRIVQLPLDPPPGPSFQSTPVALTDVGGFPLPGRSFYVSLQLTR